VYKKNLKFSKSRAAENAAQALEQPVSPQK
jgi:hypothetical protein